MTATVDGMAEGPETTTEVHATLDDGTEQARCGARGAVAFATFAFDVTCRPCRARLRTDHEAEA